MSGANDRAGRAIADARALLDTLLTSDWQELHVVSGDTEIFIARPGAGPNPLHAERESTAVPEPVTIAAPEPSTTEIKAPHVATFVSAPGVGTAVLAGERVATLRLLEEEIVLVAPVAGTIAGVTAAAGSLLDYGAPVLSLVENA